jgi:uncharacterized membrane protein YjgN (DUF898 family)
MQNTDNKPKKYEDRNANKNRYQKLLLNQKFQINAAIGLVLIPIGAIVISLSGGHEILHHWQNAVHALLGVLLLVGGLWLFSRGLRYESQLDAIRIMKRNRNFGNKKKGPRNTGPKKD